MMIREYRGWEPDIKKWVYGAAIDHNAILEDFGDMFLSPGPDYRLVDPKSIGQWVEKHNNNYVSNKGPELIDVWEGDVIETSIGNDWVRGVVTYYKTAFCLIPIGTDLNTTNEIFETINDLGGIHIIGNVYQNPELLEVK